ncbi:MULTISPECIES: hypothetical protein [Streptomyces]|uniref:hypothetical protein n=1 Tax=Streptomyces TaxID=1883 RepID=UPI002109CF6B|nr:MULTISPECIES: hypothetical protein [unclassified Streptomyces]MDQ0693597.1 hypothetical protein [Streptomyces sp. W4I9-2]
MAALPVPSEEPQDCWFQLWQAADDPILLPANLRHQLLRAVDGDGAALADQLLSVVAEMSSDQRTTGEECGAPVGRRDGRAPARGAAGTARAAAAFTTERRRGEGEPTPAEEPMSWVTTACCGSAEVHGRRSRSRASTPFEELLQPTAGDLDRRLPVSAAAGWPLARGGDAAGVAAAGQGGPGEILSASATFTRYGQIIPLVREGVV